MKTPETAKRNDGLKYCLLSIALSVLFLAGCTATQQGMGIGAGTGAAAGGLIGHASGHTTEGALIGAGVGAVGGGLIGEHIDQDRRHNRHYH